MRPPQDTAAALIERIAAHRVLGQLPADERAAWAAQMALEDFPAQATVLSAEDHAHATCWLLEGEVLLREPSGRGSVRLLPGDLFGFGLAPPAAMPWPAHAVGACRVARLDHDLLIRACAQHPALQYFFPGVAVVLADAPADADAAARSRDPHLGLITRPVHSLLRRPPVTLPPGVSIREAAQTMQAERVSSVLIVNEGHLLGLITDRDLRNRVVAQGLDTGSPLMDIATLAPMTVQQQEPAFQAMLEMVRHNIHHMPVLDGDRVVGMITATDLNEQHSTSAVYLAGDIYRQTTLEGLAEVAGKVRQLHRSLAAADATAYSSGHVITSVTDALTVRLLQLGEARFGPPPVDYVWVAAGSQARQEQTSRTDQDNCMVLDDRYDPAAHGAYFEALARFACDGLDACGYVHCPGEMMAMTDTWRQPLRRWRELFSRWIHTPEPKALMLSSVFFDLRAIYGRTELLDQLRAQVLDQAQRNAIFLAYMTSNALSHQPPLGMFGQLTTARGGEHRGTVDLKHTGIVPIVDLARVYALAGAATAVNTHDRLLQTAGGEVTEAGARDLREALEFLGALRMRHQAGQIAAGETPDSFLRPEALSNFERTQLKDAFTVVQRMQSVLSQRYTAGRF